MGRGMILLKMKKISIIQQYNIMVKQKTIKNSNQKMISTKLRIAILQDEIALWEKRCDTEPRSNLYYGYIRDMMTNRVKELKDIENIE